MHAVAKKRALSCMECCLNTQKHFDITAVDVLEHHATKQCNNTSVK